MLAILGNAIKQDNAIKLINAIKPVGVETAIVAAERLTIGAV